MFRNVGKKISGLAKLCCVLGIVLSVLVGVIFGLTYHLVNQPIAPTVTLPDGTEIIANTNGQYTPSSPVAHIVISVLIALLGSFISWVSSLGLYGFGRLITMTEENNAYLKQLAEK